MPELDRRDAVWMVFLILLVVVFFHQFVFLGRVPINADWLHAKFQPGLSYLNVRAHNSELDDPIYQFYPLRMEAVRQWREGRVPLWNPYIMCGAPLLADGISKPFDPLIVPYIAFGGPAGRGVALLCQFILMILGAYVMARGFGVGRAGAAVTAVVYTFNGLSVTWMELRTATGAFAFFPWSLLLMEAAFRRRSAALAAASGLGAGLMALAGHPQFVAYGFVLLGGYALWRSGGDWRARGAAAFAGTLGLGATALVLGLAVWAVELLPMIELASHSARSSLQYARANEAATPVTFLSYLYPRLFGDPVAGDYLGARILVRPYMTAVAGFVGASTVAFLITGLVAGRCRAKGFFLAVLFAVPVVMLLTAYGLMRSLPVFGAFFTGMDVARIVFASNFAAAMLAGAGVGALAEGTVKGRTVARLAVVLGLAVVSIVVCTALLARLAGVLALFDAGQAGALRWYLSSLGGGAAVLALPAVYVPLLFLAVGCVVVLLGCKWKAGAAAAAAVVAAELLSFGIGYNPFVKADLVAPEFAFMEVLPAKAGDGRVMGLDTPFAGPLVSSKGDFLVPNTAVLYGLEDIRGDESLRSERYFDYIFRAVPPGTSLLASIHLPVFDSFLIDQLNTRYVMSAVPLAAAHLRPVYADARAFVYENKRSVERVFMPERLLRARSHRQALNIMQAHADFLPGKVAVVESDGDLPEPAEGAPASARITQYRSNEVIIEATCSQARLLVLADSFAPGWRASVDGRGAKILAVNGVMRGVVLEAGSHQVVFSYLPESFVAGAVIAALALTVALVLFAVAAIRARTAAKRSSRQR